MLSKIYSSLLILTVLTLSGVVNSKPAGRNFRNHKIGEFRPVVAKNLKQFNWRTAKRATLATEPKPSASTTAFAMPMMVTASMPIPTGTSAGNTNGDAPAARSVDTEAEDVESDLDTSSGNEDTLKGLSSRSSDVQTNTFPGQDRVGVDTTDQSLHIPASDNVDTPFDHYINLSNRREETGSTDSMDGSDVESN